MEIVSNNNNNDDDILFDAVINSVRGLAAAAVNRRTK
jgi:hypothetical protein